MLEFLSVLKYNKVFFFYNSFLSFGYTLDINKTYFCLLYQALVLVQDNGDKIY